MQSSKPATSMISHSSIERIKEIPIVEVIKHYVPDLKKAGANWKAKSPWSNEKTASFYVVPGKNIFKDFSSGNGGDAITFVMKFGTGCTYPEAIKDIAAKCGERIEYDETTTEEQKKEVEHNEILYTINQAAAKHYQAELRKYLVLTDPEESADIQATEDHGPIYAELIAKRRFTPDTIVQWQIGFAPGGEKLFDWKFMVNLLGDKNRQHGIDLGLIKNNLEKGLTYDTFRNRIVFPIHNHHGRIVTFGGRTMKEDPYNAKYINGPESKIYKKESVLYGLHFATKAIRESGYAQLVEGYTDVISMHQAGFANTVGTCGTALTDQQCKLLRKHTSKVVILGDGDQAGQDAVLRAIDLLYPYGFDVAVVPMPVFPDKRKVDPDDLTRMFDAPKVKTVQETVPKPVMKNVKKAVKKNTKKTK